MVLNNSHPLVMNNFLRIQPHMSYYLLHPPPSAPHFHISTGAKTPPIPTSLYYRKNVMATLLSNTTFKPNSTRHFSPWKNNRCKKKANPTDIKIEW